MAKTVTVREVRNERINLIISNPSDGDWGRFSELLSRYGGDIPGARVRMAKDALRVLHEQRTLKSSS